MASWVVRESSRSSTASSSDAVLLAAFGWLSCRAITPNIPTHITTDAVGKTLTLQTPDLGGVVQLHRFGLQLALVLKDQVLQMRRANQRRTSLLSTYSHRSTSLN